MSDTSEAIESPPRSRRLAMLAVEIGERLVVTALFASLAGRMLANYQHSRNIADLLVLASEGLVVVLVFIRRPALNITFRLQDWVLTFSGSFLPLLLAPASVHSLGPSWIGWSLQTAGFIAQLFCKIFLFRNFGLAPALRGVADRGPYALVRHPMYASYFLSQLGFLYAFPTAWNAGLLALWMIAQILRINIEERVLRAAPLYRAYAARVRWRLIPGVY